MQNKMGQASLMLTAAMDAASSTSSLSKAISLTFAASGEWMLN
jgi:hypothetical protein